VFSYLRKSTRGSSLEGGRMGAEGKRVKLLCMDDILKTQKAPKSQKGKSQKKRAQNRS